jgi:hypothetical protein
MVTQAEFESATFGLGGRSKTQYTRSARSKVESSGTKWPQTIEIHTGIHTVLDSREPRAWCDLGTAQLAGTGR